jgi:hypothetical protein
LLHPTAPESTAILARISHPTGIIGEYDEQTVVLTSHFPRGKRPTTRASKKPNPPQNPENSRKMPVETVKIPP